MMTTMMTIRKNSELAQKAESCWVFEVVAWGVTWTRKFQRYLSEMVSWLLHLAFVGAWHGATNQLVFWWWCILWIDFALFWFVLTVCVLWWFSIANSRVPQSCECRLKRLTTSWNTLLVWPTTALLLAIINLVSILHWFWLCVFCACSPLPRVAFHSHVTVPLEATENLLKHNSNIWLPLLYDWPLITIIDDHGTWCVLMVYLEVENMSDLTPLTDINWLGKITLIMLHANHVCQFVVLA